MPPFKKFAVLHQCEVYYVEPDGTWDNRPGTHANSGFVRPSGRAVACTAERAPHLAAVLAPGQRRLAPETQSEIKLTPQAISLVGHAAILYSRHRVLAVTGGMGSAADTEAMPRSYVTGADEC